MGMKRPRMGVKKAGIAALCCAALLLASAGGAAAQLVTVKSSGASCGNAADATVLAANKNRTMLGLVHDSDTVMYFAFGEAAVSGKGLRLAASGGAVLYDARVPVGAVHCITAGAAKNVSIHEGSK